MIGIKLLHCDSVCGPVGGWSAIDNRLNDTQCRLETKINLLPVELRIDLVRRGVRIIEEVAIQVRQIYRQGLHLRQERCKRFGNGSGMTFVAIGTQSDVAALLVSQQGLK